MNGELNKDSTKYTFRNKLGYNNVKNLEADVFFCFQNVMSHMNELFITDLDNSTIGLDGMLNMMMDDIQEQHSLLHDHLINTLHLDPKFYGQFPLSF